MRQILATVAMTGVFGVSALGFVSQAQGANVVGTYPGNDCTPQTPAGLTTGNGANCVLNQVTGNGVTIAETPLIIKYNFNANGTISSTEIGASFAGVIDGSEFTFNFATGGPGTGDGTWTYTPGPGDPAVTAFIAKGGPNFNLFANPGNPNSSTYFTPTNPNNNQLFGLSHLTFFDTSTVTVPEPSTVLGLSAIIGGVLTLRRRKSD